MEVKIFYICDRKKCEHCHSECRYTSDIRHAANFKDQHQLVNGELVETEMTFWEKDSNISLNSGYQFQPGFRTVLCNNVTVPEDMQTTKLDSLKVSRETMESGAYSTVKGD